MITFTEVLKEFDLTLGLEVHAQVASKTKVWCHCPITVGQSFENYYVCEICSGHPGTLPVLNEEVLNKAITLGLALEGTIVSKMNFDRKNYFYPDLPKGYQITQFKNPIVVNAKLALSNFSKTIAISRIQIEEDTGKSTHHQDYSLLNYNRCGTPLLEIITEPDFNHPDEAVDYLKKLHAILKHLGVSKGNLQDGNFRCDVNVSLSLKGSPAGTLGTRCEVKNLNSFKNVEKSIIYESARQAEILKSGDKVLQQTRLYNMQEDKTYLLRTKSDADDYRYFPEPDLPLVTIPHELVQALKSKLPELPEQMKTRLKQSFELNDYDANLLSQSVQTVQYFESCLNLVPDAKKIAKKIANWISTELFRFLNEYNLNIEQSPVSPKHLVDLVMVLESGKISHKQAKEVFVEMFDQKKSPIEIIASKGLEQTSDESGLTQMIKDLIEKNPKEVAGIKAGNARMMGFFVGQVMKMTDGKANPQLVTEILKKLI